MTEEVLHLDHGGVGRTVQGRLDEHLLMALGSPVPDVSGFGSLQEYVEDAQDERDARRLLLRVPLLLCDWLTDPRGYSPQ